MKYTAYEKYMREALAEAQIAFSAGEVPVGCVIVNAQNEIISRAHNMVETDRRTCAHAEFLALEQAEKLCDLSECTLYTTLEPCGMCAGAIAHHRIRRVIFGAYDPEYGCTFSKINLPLVMGHAAECIGGVCEEECEALLKEFFRSIRQ